MELSGGERRQSLPGVALCLPWEGIGESKAGLGQCESLAGGKGLWDGDTAEGREVREEDEQRIRS